MTRKLKTEAVASYWERGFLSRIPVLTPEGAASALAELEAIEAAQAEAHGGSWDDRNIRPWDHDPHPLEDWARAIVTSDNVLDAVASILGEDLLIRNVDVFVKDPGIRRGIGWHQDTAEKGEDADCLLTVWLGLTASTPETGGLFFSAGSHRLDIPGGPKDKYTLTLTKEAAAHLDPDATHANVMEPGMMSMHHFRTVHSSPPNRSDHRRVALVGRFMSTRISQETAESGAAVLVRGKDGHGHFALKDRFPMTWTG